MNISFAGLKQNLLYGRQAIADVRRDFPNGFKSNTHYEIFGIEKDDNILQELEEGIYRTRERIDEIKRHGYLEKDAVEIAVRETGIANCGEQASLVSKKLDRRGIRNQIIEMNIYRNGKNPYQIDGHSFCIIGASPNMDVKNPKTWGEDAVIVDMWSNTVKRVPNALRFFSRFIVPKSDEHIQFNSGMYY